ncbi:soluble quino protein glucose/sorbosone dehydrogenase [Lineolata rhizophorae]|uniref:Soluble quino protein glucose/sorbosone dehydrogenase n=1 Tax=Lineolata rhizophorae TaxID=578093 RepID=A0A6A6NTX7_9PEZI|nr:soluble quino protein glucose/sorbosone dehydrogenase [Lineolata rhizophorae]
MIGRLVIALAALQARALAQSCPSLTANYPSPSVADGFDARLIVQDLTKPRGMVFDHEGNLLVVESGKGITAMSLSYGDGSCVSVQEKKTIVSDTSLNHGIELSSDGNTLYASNSDMVFSFDYDAGSMTNTSSGKAIVTGMASDDLVTRTLLIPRSADDKLLVSRGGDDNMDFGTVDLDSGRSQIRIFDLGGDDAVDYLEGEVLGWGLRNSVGVGENPRDGGIWSVENSVDDIERDGESIHADNPAEELNYHGILSDDDDDNAYLGANYGFPLCYAAWDVSEIPGGDGLSVGDQFAIGEENATVNDPFCAQDRQAPRLVFTAHTAPLDIKFDSQGDNAYISFHGSWNSPDPVGYRLSVVPFGPSGQPTAPSTSTTAARPILSNEDLDSCPDDCFRPAGLAWDNAGRLYMTSDSTGEIYVLVRADGAPVDANRESGAGAAVGGRRSAWAVAVVAGAAGVAAWFM